MRTRLGVCAALALAAVACSGGGGSTPAGPKLLAIAIEPNGASTLVGGTVAFHAIGTYDDQSTRDLTEQATWRSSRPATATVSGAGTRGVATALAAGTTVVSAAVGAIGAETELTVVAATVTSIRVDPAAPVLGVGGTVALRCLGATGIPSVPEVDVTGLAVWSSDHPDVAPIAAGVVSGLKVGDAVITATFGALIAHASVAVDAATLEALAIQPSAAEVARGASGRFEAFARYTDGSQRRVTDLAAFSSGAPSVLAVAANGVYQALAAGGATITATWSGRTASSAVSVVPDAVIALVVEGAPDLLPAGDALPLRATAIHLDGSSADVSAEAIWTSDAPLVASVAGSGEVSALAAGSAVVHATSGGLSAATIVAVTTSPATSLTVSPATAALVVGATVQLSGTLVFADGTSVAAAKVAAAAPADAAVVGVERRWDGALLLRALAPGTTSVAVTAGGLRRDVTVTVSAPTSLLVGWLPTLVVGVVEGLSASARAGTSSSPEVGSLADWFSDAPGVAEVSRQASGYWILTARAAGTAHVTATFAGATGSATVTVRDRPLRIEVAPAAFQVVVRGSQSLTATGYYANGSTIDLTSAVDWNTEDWQVGGMSFGNAIFDGSSPGKTFVTASVAGLVGVAEATVYAEPPTSLLIAPWLSDGQSGPYVLPPGSTAQLWAAGQSTYGFETKVAGVTWTSSVPSVAAFSADPTRPGLLAAIAPGTTTVTASYLTAAGATLTRAAAVYVAPLTALAASPTTVTFAVGGGTTLRATGTFDGGASGPFTADVSPWVVWTSSAPDVARAEAVFSSVPMVGAPSAVVDGRSTGTAVLTAALAPATATAQVAVTVTPPVVSNVRVAVRTGLVPGAAFAPAAYATVEPGSYFEVDVTALAEWHADGAVLSVSGTPPVVQVLGAGSGTLSATFRGVTRTVSVTVLADPWDALLPDVRALTLPPGATQSFRVREYRHYISGADVSGEATVATSNPAVATAEPGLNGIVVSAHAPGEAIVTATYGGVEARVAVNVFELDPVLELGRWGVAALHVHEREALLVDAWIAALHGYYGGAGGLAWSSSDPAVLRVSADGVVEGVAPGHAVVTGASPRFTASIPFTVSAATLEALAVWPEVVPLPVGTEVWVEVGGGYSDGVSVILTPSAQCSSASPAIAALDPAAPGRVRALAAGTARIDCRLDGRTGEAMVTVF